MSHGLDLWGGCQTEAMSDDPPLGVRARARAQLLDDVERVAKGHLAESGAASLSVRAIARDLGLASSALYRYYPSRDALLTQLIIDSYNALGAAVEDAERVVDRADLPGRYSAICHGVRDWAVANPHEYALIYGSPVPGYAAPDDTIDPAVRTALVLLHLAADIDPARLPGLSRPPIPRRLSEQITSLADATGVEVDPHVIAAAVGLWAQIFGLVSFELFGTFHNTFDDARELFDHQIRLGTRTLGLAAP